MQNRDGAHDHLAGASNVYKYSPGQRCFPMSHRAVDLSRRKEGQSTEKTYKRIEEDMSPFGHWHVRCSNPWTVYMDMWLLVVGSPTTHVGSEDLGLG
jgi:hypothetical protein